MLKVKTTIGPSKIHGIGLFAAEFIKAGTLIFEEDEFTYTFTKEQYEKMSDLQKSFFDVYAYYNNNIYKCSLDNDRFFNHSINPNTTDIADITIAKYDINPGEEITCNYNDLFDNENIKNKVIN